MNNSGLEYVIRLALQKIGVVEGVDAVRSSMDKLGETSRKVGEVAADTGEKIGEGMDAVATAANTMQQDHNQFITNSETGMKVVETRKTLPDFYARLGCPQTPQPQFINNRESTGYNVRVLGYDYVIQRLGLDPQKVLVSAKENLFALEYTKQNTTAVQALLDGGLDTFKCVNGRKITRTQIKKIVTLCRKGFNETRIEFYMRQDGIIP